MADFSRFLGLGGFIALALGLSASAWAESTFGLNGHSASARVHIRVTIPPLVAILQNQHPATLPPTSGPSTALQRIVLHTNVRHGACADLQATGLDASSWRLRSVGSEPLSVDPLPGGWRLCTQRQGTHTLLLEHEFETAPPGPWPLRTGTALL